MHTLPAWGSRVVRGVLLGAGLAAAAVPSAAADKKLPKKPDRPLVLAVMAAPHAEPTTPDEIKAAKEVSDSVADIQANITKKHRDWFTLVSDPEQAEVILQVEKRGWEEGHGTVIRGKAHVLDMTGTTILGQGALNPDSLNFSHWKEAAGDMTGRLQTYCQETYAEVTTARSRGVRPLAVLANDRGIELIHAKDAAGASAAFAEAIRLAPAYPLPYMNRALVAAGNGDWEHAIADFDATLKLDPAQPKALYFRGIAHLARKETDPARKDFDAAIQADPKMANAYSARGGILLETDAPAAIADFTRALELGDSDKATTLGNRGRAWDKLGDGAKALADYDASLALVPGEHTLRYARGFLLKKTDEKRACADFEAAAALEPQDADYVFERALCAAGSGATAKAIDDLTKCINLRPDMALAYYNRSVLYGRQKKTKLAAADHAQAVKLDPSLAKKK